MAVGDGENVWLEDYLPVSLLCCSNRHDGGIDPPTYESRPKDGLVNLDNFCT